MLYCFDTCKCNVFSMPTMMAVWKTLYWIIMMPTMQAQRLPNLWGGYSLQIRATATVWLLRNAAFYSLADMKLLFISQVVVLTDSAACVRKLKRIFEQTLLSSIGVRWPSRQPWISLCNGYYKKTSKKRGQSFLNFIFLLNVQVIRRKQSQSCHFHLEASIFYPGW